MKTEEFKQWVPRLQPSMQRMAEQLLDSRQEAKDVVQDLFVELWENRKKLDKVDNLPGYCVRMTQFHCIDYLKANRLRVKEIGPEERDIPANPSDFEEREELFAELQRHMSHLSEEEQQLLRLRFWDNLSGREIANNVGISEVNVRVRLNRIIQKLKSDFKSTTKNNMKHSLKFFILTFFVMASLGLHAQQPREFSPSNTPDSAKNTFKLGLSFMPYMAANIPLPLMLRCGTFQYERRLGDLFGLGMYVGFCSGGLFEFIDHAPLNRKYGLKASFHFLPIVTPYHKEWDPYLFASGGVDVNVCCSVLSYDGGIYKPVGYDDLVAPEWGIGFGLNYYFNNHWGFFGEYSFGRTRPQGYFSDDDLLYPIFSLGLNYKF